MDIKLTERERSVIHGFANGLDAEAIAEQLGITTEQVEQASLNVLHKLFSGAIQYTLENSETVESPNDELVAV